MLDWLATVAPERHAVYMAWAGGHGRRAAELYQLNLRVSEAWYIPLHTLEVLLRNQTHNYMAQKIRGDWLTDSNLITLPEHQQHIQDIMRRFDCENDNTKLMNELNFSFWTGLYGRHYDHLWRTWGLRKIFQHKSAIQRASLAHKLKEIRHLRNKIAHYEPILHLPLTKIYIDTIEICGWLEPSCLPWLNAVSRFPQVYPRNGLNLVKS
jgi:hypothetical protein